MHQPTNHVNGSGGDTGGRPPADHPIGNGSSPDGRNPFREIQLPDGTDPVTKGIVRHIRMDDGIATLEVDLEGLGDTLATRIAQQLHGAALAMAGVEHVRLQAVAADAGRLELPGVDHVIAVASTKGGVGKTTVSVALARALSQQGKAVGLFDADIYGPNVPHLFDLEGPVLTNEHGQPVPLDAGDIQILSPGVVAGNAPVARRGAIAFGAINNLLGEGDWQDRDVLIIDMPAGTDDIAGAVLEHVPIDGAVFVTTPFDASVDDTRRTIELFESNDVSPIAAVVNMNRLTCDCCGEAMRLFDDPVDLPVPAIVELPFERSLQRDLGETAIPHQVKGLAASVDQYLADRSVDLPEGALDLRRLPRESQARQLVTELARTDPGDGLISVVEDGSWVEAAVWSDVPELIARSSRSPSHGASHLEFVRTETPA